MPEFPSLSDEERDRLRALGISAEGSYWAWRAAIDRGEIAPKLLTNMHRIALTYRVLEAGGYLASGLTAQETADRMSCALETVKTYTKHLRAAAGTRTTATAVIKLVRAGVIEPR